MRGFFSWLVISYTLIFSFRSFASVGPRLIDSLSSKEAQAIEKALERKVTKDLKVSHLKNFHILWNDKLNECIDSATQEHPDAFVGVCSVSFSAHQVSGTAALVRGMNGNSVSIIQYDVD